MPNEDRKLILDLAAIEAMRGPHPNDYFICLTKGEAASACYAIATCLDMVPCEIEDCDNCNAYRRLFWDMANELGALKQRELFRFLEANEITIPSGPWDEIRG